MNRIIYYIVMYDWSIKYGWSININNINGDIAFIVIRCQVDEFLFEFGLLYLGFLHIST